MLSLLLQGYSGHVAQHGRVQATELPPPPAQSPPGRSTLHDTSCSSTRRRYRSRNCRSFRLYGPFFQFADPNLDRHSGRSFMGRRASRVRDARVRRDLRAVELQLERLVQERELLESRRICARSEALLYALGVAERFYELFKNGFDPGNRADASREAESFLRAVMLENVVCSEFTGVDLFLRQYEVGTRNHSSLTLELKKASLVDNGDDSIQVRAEATARFRISRRTLEQLFPSVINDEVLTQRLIGKEYQMQYEKVFHFADGRIFQHESRIDMCGGLLEMVGDPFLALKLYEASILTKHGHWKVSEEIQEDRNQLENTLLS